MLNQKKDESVYWKISTGLLTIAVVGLLLILIFSGGKPKCEYIPQPIQLEVRREPQYGIFMDAPTMWEYDRWGRGGDADFGDTAVILEANSVNNTLRWLRGIIRQRKWSNDLPVYIFPNENSNSSLYFDLKRLREQFDNVFVIKNGNNSLVTDVLKRPQIQFLIEVEDTKYMGADFADYYYMGKEVLAADTYIDCVCGGIVNQKDDFVQPAAGDIYWLMENGEDCEIGPMHRRVYFEDEENGFNSPAICVRPEVDRVAEKENHVSRMRWYTDRFDPKLLTKHEFFRRIQTDLLKAKPMQKVEWGGFKRMDKYQVYMFPYNDEQDLAHYFEEQNVHDIVKTRKYGGVIPLFFESRKIYIVSTKVFQDVVNLQSLNPENFP